MTMTKNRLILLASVPLTFAVTLGVLAMLPPGPGVTKANFDRIREGMTYDEVEHILGQEGIHRERREAVLYYWEADNGSQAWIQFQGDFCVVEKRWHDSDETFFDKIRRWLRLR